MTGSWGGVPMEYEQIKAWVDAHRADLPSNLAELSRYPMAFRRVIHGAVPNEVRAAWWVEHMQAVLASDTELSTEQRKFIQEHIVALPSIFGVGMGDKPPLVESLKEQMDKLFSPELRGQVFGALGPLEPPGGLPLPPDAPQFT